MYNECCIVEGLTHGEVVGLIKQNSIEIRLLVARSLPEGASVPPQTLPAGLSAANDQNTATPDKPSRQSPGSQVSFILFLVILYSSHVFELIHTFDECTIG